MQNNFDVIIGGAGISGLLIASRLSADFKVLVVENDTHLRYDKFWVTSKECIDGNDALKGAIDHEFHSMAFEDAYSNEHLVNGDYILWDTESLLNLLKDKLIENGGEIRFSQRFCGYQLQKDSIELFVNEHRYRSKLFIDCMGFKSPLVLAKDTVSIRGYYYLYGGRIKLKEPIKPICLSNIILDKSPKYFEVFPDSKGFANAVIIYPSETIRSDSNVSKDFDYIIKQSKYAKHFSANGGDRFLGGVVPVGSIRKKALDRIFFFGESAQSNPSATGTCLTRLMTGYAETGIFLSDCINSERLDEASLSKAPDLMNSFIRKLQMHAFSEMLKADSDRFADYIGLIPKISDETLNRFIFGSLSAQNTFDIQRIRKLFTKEFRHLSIPILKVLSKTLSG